MFSVIMVKVMNCDGMACDECFVQVYCCSV